MRSPTRGFYAVCLAIENLSLAVTTNEVVRAGVSFYREDYLRSLMRIPQRARPVACCVPPSACQIWSGTGGAGDFS